jgi:hypothetical protein
VATPELRERADPVGPLLRLRAVERPHVDDEEVVTLLGPQLIDRLLHPCLACRVEHARAVGDPVGQSERRIGRGDTSARQQEQPYNNTESDESGPDDEAHGAHRAPKVSR